MYTNLATYIGCVSITSLLVLPSMCMVQVQDPVSLQIKYMFLFRRLNRILSKLRSLTTCFTFLQYLYYARNYLHRLSSIIELYLRHFAPSWVSRLYVFV